MDSTTPTDLHLLSPLNSSPRKLPVKRKTPLPPPTNNNNDPDLRRRPPFKFHRIWTEPDEIRFLQGLLDSSLSFPRDLNIFYTRFCTYVSQPYSKSQLSEKLRRLRKKWRVISSRLAKGLDISRLSPHDRALFDLSKKLWHPDFSSTSPFAASPSPSASTALVSPTQNKLPLRSDLFVKVNLSPSPSPSIHVPNQTTTANAIYVNNNNKPKVDFNFAQDSCYDDLKLSQVKVELKENEDRLMLKRHSHDTGNQIGEIVAKTVLDVFDQSLKDVKLGIFEKAARYESFEKRWQELRAVEMEAFAQRLRLVVEDSIQKR